jgi:HlyD family secretion protein
VTEIASSAKTSAGGTAEQKTEFEVKVGVRDIVPELRPGMTASAEIVTETKDSVVGVPIQCVAVRTPEQLTRPAESGAATAELPTWSPDEDGFVSVVFAVVDGRALARQVKTGIQSETHIEIVDGLADGQEVVVGSYRAISRDLQHGTPVAPRSGPPGPAEAQARR